MIKNRKPFQAALDLFRINQWYFIISYLLVILFLIYHNQLDREFQLLGYWLVYKVLFINTLAFISSTLIYDYSSFYTFKWMDSFAIPEDGRFINLTAGVDQSTKGLKQKFPNGDLKILEIFEEKKSKNAVRKLRFFIPPQRHTLRMIEPRLPVADDSVDTIFMILCGHDFQTEWHDPLFAEIKRVIKRKGMIIMVEPLADIPNFLAYNIGMFNYKFGFQWRALFRRKGFAIMDEKRVTPFLKAYKLQA